VTDEAIWLALRDCYDPELPLNIVELGMVDTIALARDVDAPGARIPGVPDRYAVRVTLLPSERDETAEAQLAGVVHNRLAGLPELSRIAVQFAAAPQWTPARISPDGRRRLGLDQPRFPIRVR
jgi:metal-sulfur cluster biosynthetic enzyme